MNEVVLTVAQKNALRELDDFAKQTDDWVDTVDFDKALLQALERQNLIVLEMNPDARLMARTTGKGRRTVRPDDVMVIPATGEVVNPPLQPGEGEKEAAPMKADDVCSEDGCDQPRMVAKNGTLHPRCQEHMRAYWREQTNSRSRKSPKEKKVAKKPVERVNGHKPEPATIELPPLAPEHVPTQVYFRSDPTEQPEIPPEEPCADGCEHAAMLALVRAMFPEVDEAVDLLERAEAARRKLGL